MSRALFAADFYADNIIGRVDTVLELLQVETALLKDGYYYLVGGFHSKGDGGGGVFYWDANEDKANHDGGTIIDPTQPFPNDWSDISQQNDWFTANGSGGGCWKRVHNNNIDARWFGARNNSVVDSGNIIKHICNTFTESITLVIDDIFYIISDVTIPENVNLKFSKVGTLHVKTKDPITGENVGTGDGSTTTFTLSDPPVLDNSEKIYVNGVEQTRGSDYTIDYLSGTITFTNPPADGDTITADYTPQYKLTIDGHIDAGLFHIFDGDGRVTGNPRIKAVYPEWFGAVGDGETDDTEAIQKAIDFSNSVRFQNRVYVVSDEILIPSNRIITGCNTIIKSNSSLPPKTNRPVISCPLMSIIGSHDVTVSNISFDAGVGMVSEGEGSCLYIDNSNNVLIKECEFKNGREYVVAIGASGNCKNITIESCKFTLDRTSIASEFYSTLLVVTNAEEVFVENCRFSHTSSDTNVNLFDCENWGTGDCNVGKLRLENNNFNSSTGSVVLFYAGIFSNIHVSENDLENCFIKVYGQIPNVFKIEKNRITPPQYGIYLYNCSSNNHGTFLVKDNRVDGGEISILVGNDYTENPCGFVISNNLLYDFSSYGINFVSAATSESFVDGNVINGSGIGIRLYSTDNVTIKGNRIVCDIGLSFENDCRNILMYGNYLDCSTLISAFSLSSSRLQYTFEYAFSSTGPETIFSVPTGGQGKLVVYTNERLNNNDKKYIGEVNFSTAGTDTVSITEFGEVASSYVNYSTNDMDIQGTLYNDAVAHSYKIDVDLRIV